MKFKCQICGYIYDEANEKVNFADLPDSWKCPWCGAAKSDFKAEGSEEPKPAAAKPEKVVSETIKQAAITSSDLTRLTPGQLSAVCSNLARGCEKQYKHEESALFKELASYFDSISPAVNDATVEKLAEMLQNDVDNYSSVRATADEASDRGAARICVWGEKVTRMLSSLVNRYLKEGDSMIEGAQIWVCSVCGFVYIGESAPELCPVCKVPSWKFEKIEGRD